jgi:Zn-dependent protease
MFWTMLFGIVLVHEFGHCFGARSVGGRADHILMWPLGGLAFASAPMRAWPQFVTVAAGPAVNVAFCLISGAILVISNGTFDAISLNPLSGGRGVILTQTWHLPVFIFYQVNLFLLAFNLLPIYPLDGGQLFQTIMWPMLGLQRSMKLACQVGIGGAVVFAVFGIQSNEYMLLGIAIFAGMTCWQRLQQLKWGMIQEDALPGGYDFSQGYTSLERGSRRKEGLWSRIFARRRRPRKVEPVNPNPGAWERKLDRERELEGELDRILKKVSEQGLHTLTYVERQTLERATRERQKRESELGRTDKL